MSHTTLVGKKYLQKLVKEEMDRITQDIGLGVGVSTGPGGADPGIGRDISNPIKDFKNSIKKQEVRYFLNAKNSIAKDIRQVDKYSSRIVLVPSKKTINLGKTLKKLKIDKSKKAKLDNIKSIRMGIAFFIKWYGSAEGLKELGPGLRPVQKDYANYFFHRVLDRKEITDMNTAIMRILNIDGPVLQQVQQKSENFEGFYLDVATEIGKHKRIIEPWLKKRAFQDKEWNSAVDLVSVAISILASFHPYMGGLSFTTSLISDFLIFTTIQTALGGSFSLKKIRQDSASLLEELKNKIQEVKSDVYELEEAESGIFIILDRIWRLIDSFLLEIAQHDKEKARQVRFLFKDIENTSQIYRQEITGERSKDKLIQFAGNKLENLSNFFDEVGKIEQTIETTLSYSIEKQLNDFINYITTPVDPIIGGRPMGLLGSTWNTILDTLNEEEGFGEDIETNKVKRGILNLIGKGKDIDRLEEYIDFFNQALQSPDRITPSNDIIASLKTSRGGGFFNFVRKAESDASALWQKGENLRSRFYDRESAIRRRGGGVMLSPELDEFMINGWLGLTRVDLSALGAGRRVYSIGFLNYDDDRAVPISFITSTRAGAQSTGLAAAIKNGTIGIKRSTGEVIYPEHVNDVTDYFLSLIKSAGRAEKLIEIIEEKNIDALKKYIVFLKNYITFLQSTAGFLQIYSNITSEDGLNPSEAKILLDNIANIAYWFSRWSRYE